MIFRAANIYRADLSNPVQQNIINPMLWLPIVILTLLDRSVLSHRWHHLHSLVCLHFNAVVFYIKLLRPPLQRIAFSAEGCCVSWDRSMKAFWVQRT
jgi:hypothetical protein